MTEALLSLLIGILISIASAVLLHIAARKCRTAPPSSAWRSESVATTLSLGLVALIVIGASWTIKGTILMMPEALSGIAVGMLLVAAAIFITLRTIGRMPSLADEAPRAPELSATAPAVKRAA